MKRRFFIAFVAALALILLGTNTAPAKSFHLKLATHVPPQHYANKVFEQWIGELDKRSGGRVKVTLYPGQSLGKIPDEWNMLKSGISDIGWILPMYYPGAFPLADVTDLPYLIPHGKRDLTIINGIFNKFLREQFQDVQVLWPGFLGFPQLHTTKKPVETLEDLKGMQIRCPPGPLTLSLEALGATPAQIPTPEVYTALERNIVDGCTIPWEGALAFKFYEVAKYHTTMDLGCGMFIVAMNQKAWKKLPPDIQKILEDLSSWAQKLFNDSADATDEKALSVMQKAENTIIRLTPQEKARWVEATKPVVDKWAAKLDDRGLPGTAIVEEMRKLGSN